MVVIIFFRGTSLPISSALATSHRTPHVFFWNSFGIEVSLLYHLFIFISKESFMLISFFSFFWISSLFLIFFLFYFSFFSPFFYLCSHLLVSHFAAFVILFTSLKYFLSPTKGKTGSEME